MMAPSKPCLAFFLAIALLAATPQPSAAVRAKPPAPPTTDAKPPKWHITDLLPSCWPIFGPPTPTPPSPPHKPPPKECLPSMTGMLPCKDFITNKNTTAPPYPGRCCDGLNSLMYDTPVCWCHLFNGEFDKFMSAPVDIAKFADLFDTCHFDGPISEYCDGPVPPVVAGPPPPPSKPEVKECLPSMTGMLPCKDFLTNKTSPAPPYPSKCCDGVTSLMIDSPICWCHLFDGEFDKFMSAPVDDAHFVDLLDICHFDGKVVGCDGPVPPVVVGPPPPPSKPEVKECMSPMMGMMPCKDFITNKTAPEPPYPSKCCDGFKSLMEDAPVCLCHLNDGEFDKFMSAPVDGVQFLSLLNICHSDGPSGYSCNGPVPPVRASPAP